VLAAASTVAAVLVLLHARRRRLRAAWLASVRVTRGSIDDARSRIESLRPLVEECFPGMMEGDDGEDTVDQLCGFYEPDDCIALFADDEHGLCGLALLFPVRSARESSLYISAVCVRASCQGRGLGGRIMRTASTVAADEGLPTLAGSVQASEQQRCAPHPAAPCSPLQPPAAPTCSPLLHRRPALRPHTWRVCGVRHRLVPFYTRLGGALRTDHAVAGGGAALFLLRLEAPSGPATSRGAPSPRRFSASEMHGETHGEMHGETQRGPAEGGVSPGAQWERLAELVEAQLHVRPSAEQVARCTRDSRHGCAVSLTLALTLTIELLHG